MAAPVLSELEEQQMKLLVQSDDYGFTRSIMEGVLDALERGIITSTGLFANMPLAEEAVKRISQYPDVCLGIDINVVSGPSVLPKEQLPTLVNQETGMFIQTSERQKDPRWGKEDIFKPYNEVYAEGCAQVGRFIELAGKKPEYLQSHSTSGSKEYLRAIADVAHHYGIPFSYEVYAKYNIKTLFTPNVFGGDPYSWENQMVDEVKMKLQLLEENKDEEYVLLPSHCGFVDAELMAYSRCNLDRAYDHQYLTSPLIRQWIKDHDCQLISFRDLPL